MRYWLLYSTFCFFLPLTAQWKKKVTLQYFIAKSDCAGASGTGGGRKVYLTNLPFANQKIYLYKKNKCIDTLITDKEGKISTKLSYGKYKLFISWKHHKKVPYGNETFYDMDCLRKEWTKCNGYIKIGFMSRHVVSFDIGLEPCPWEYPCIKKIIIQPQNNGGG